MPGSRRNIYVYQIFYDDISRRELDGGFIPLDNLSNERPDWFEFWVIRRFLTDTKLQEGAWYGFLSPKFQRKTGVNSKLLYEFLEHTFSHADVALISPGWDQIAYFRNVFEQGEFWHPGLFDTSQRFFDRIGLNINLRTLTSHSLSSVFSNYIVAKPRFWNEWLRIANLFFEYVEHGDDLLSAAARSKTTYGTQNPILPMKTFVQERISSVIMAQGDFRVVNYDLSAIFPIFPKLFVDGLKTRRLLQTCDLLKQQYVTIKVGPPTASPIFLAP